MTWGEEWAWEEAFLRYGFNDGEDARYSDLVINFLVMKDYEVQHIDGCHNHYIEEVKKGRKVLFRDREYECGDQVRSAMAPALVSLLDGKFRPSSKRAAQKSRA